MIALGFGHALPAWLAVLGLVALVVTPTAFVLYVREALRPREEV